MIEKIHAAVNIYLSQDLRRQITREKGTETADAVSLDKERYKRSSSDNQDQHGSKESDKQEERKEIGADTAHLTSHSEPIITDGGHLDLIV
ncbi:MAG: hypothetical protein KDD42_10060 [Bdellovibrionales bacterium]|nr:hypothetical protein [Bdellovibrionales bacterium]